MVNKKKKNSKIKKVAIIYIPGYRKDNSFSFLKNFILKEKKYNFFSFSYKLEKTNGDHFTIKEIIFNLKKDMVFLLSSYSFDEYYLVGYSLGAALAVEIAAEKFFRCDQLILISIFDDRKDLLKSRDINLSNNENIRPFNNIKKIKKTPTIFIHGIFDKAIDLKRGLRVFYNSNRRSMFIVLPTDHHFRNISLKTFLIKILDSFS